MDIFKRLTVLLTCVFIFACSESNQQNGTLVLVVDAAMPAVDMQPDGALQADAMSSSACEFQGNGVCDEPSRCALGTDEVDCVEACAMGGDGLAFFAAACAHRDETTPSLAGSFSEIRVGDWIDEIVAAPDPAGGDRPRQIRIFMPPGLDGRGQLPLVLMLPGNRVSHYSVPSYTELDGCAAANGFMVVYVEQPWRDRTFSWSWYTDWQWAMDAHTNPDLLFLRRLVDHLVATRPVDASRVYLAGHSRGAAMSVIAALEMPDVFAGAIPQSGFVEFGYFERMAQWTGARRPAFFFMHGALDDDVCIDCRPGGRCGLQPGRSCGTVAASDALVERLRTLGWDESDLHYERPERVAHRWQPWLNQSAWDFISQHRVLGEAP
jgi:poly(3-hydroxybutyrate) depolymerase